MRCYLWNPTLADYILVWQDAPIVEQFTRLADGSWRFQFFHQPEQNCVIESVNCSLSLAEIFDRIEFEQTGEEYLQLFPDIEETPE